MLITDLPADILASLPEYLDSLDDLHSLILTSRCLHTWTSNPTPSVVRSLATTPESGIQPYPHVFIAVKARALADWAIQSPENRNRLSTAITTGGPVRLCDLALSISPLTLDDLAFLRITCITVLEPAITILKGKCDVSSVDDSLFPRCHNITLSVINFWIYCDLFHHNIIAPSHATGADALEPLSNQTRLKWMFHCLSDVNCMFEHPPGDPCGLDEMHRLCMNGIQPLSEKWLIPSLLWSHVHDDVLRERVLYRCAGHMGLATLQLVLLKKVEPKKLGLNSW
ncbi:hypothetical protein A0H81_00412 [Grifola frondosa]|uniref:F-box domain-containing protein n=1 Tax=Grifola frondosa TaxID=5627 RepID=A0A1C7MW74_GRIFR|nr:hypothetical protein A0H81_00412 [Grifola frondosa]